MTHRVPAEGRTAILELTYQRQFRIAQLADLATERAERSRGDDEARRQVSQVLTVAAQTALDDINAALQRLEDGSFGICERCGDTIAAQRLRVLPMSRSCTPCEYLVQIERASEPVPAGKASG